MVRRGRCAMDASLAHTWTKVVGEAHALVEPVKMVPGMTTARQVLHAATANVKCSHA
jgi:hypothetical protein